MVRPRLSDSVLFAILLFVPLVQRKPNARCDMTQGNFSSKSCLASSSSHLVESGEVLKEGVEF